MARVHPEDAAPHGIEDGDTCRIVSCTGRAIELAAKVSDEVSPGTIAVPHGWGHRGGWRRATEAGGANVNQLASSDPEDLERLAGMAHLNGIPVRLESVAARRAGRGVVVSDFRRGIRLKGQTLAGAMRAHRAPRPPPTSPYLAFGAFARPG